MQNKVVVRTAALALAAACVAAAGFTAGRAAFADEDRYLGIGTSTSYSETINYDHKETVSAEIPYGLPYYSSNKYENECAPMAGTVLVGYYDRFLANQGKTALKIGICYDFQIVDKIPAEGHDVPADAIVTDARIFRRANTEE